MHEQLAATVALQAPTQFHHAEHGSPFLAVANRQRHSILCPAVLACGLLLLVGGSTSAQDRTSRELKVQGFNATGPRSSITESAGTLQIIVSNPDDTDRLARVVAFYSATPDVQFARDVWVPARSIITTWLPIGPAPPAEATTSRQIEMLLYDRTDGTEKLILPPGQERVRSRAVFYRKREPTTAVMLDWLTDLENDESRELHEEGVLTLARLVRQVPNLSDYISHVPSGPLPPTPEAFDGIDVLVLAGNRLGDDPPGRAAVRRWVQQGGTLWVMLDLVQPAVIAPILGDDAPLSVVDRIELTSIRMYRPQDNPRQAEIREVERPIDLVRVIPSSNDEVLYLANGWPALFTRKLGRGKVVFTTLGDRAWWEPPSTGSGPGSRPQTKDLQTPSGPVALPPVIDLASELHPLYVSNPLPPDVLQPLLTEEIGYTIVSRGTAAAILVSFVVSLLVVGLLLRRSRRPEVVGWLIPALALIAVTGLIALGERSRQTIPPTLGIAALVDPVASSQEATLNGLFASFTPSSGPVPLGSQHGAILELDAEGLSGQVRRRVQKDIDIWAWDGLSLPAGVRTGPFKATMNTGRISATARFGPEGIEGRLEMGRFHSPADALVLPPTRELPNRDRPNREPLPVRLRPDGTFTAVGTDALPPGNYIAGVVLDDRQQRRQAVYHQFFSGPLPHHLEDRHVLFTWAATSELPFQAGDGSRLLSNALLAIPIEFERPTPGSRVTVPRGFLTLRRMVDDVRTMPVAISGTDLVDMRLRFQLPASVVPLKLERATLFARVQAPARRFSLAGAVEGKPVPLFEGSGTLDAIRVEITDPRILQPDERGGLYLRAAISESTDPANQLKWHIESLSLEVVGIVEERR